MTLLPLANSIRSMGANSTKSIYDITVKDAKGRNVELGQYRGKVLLIVNVASACGLTDANYSEMNQLYQKYNSQGFEILAFPCNQFLEQEPGTDNEIQQFACERFGVEYQILAKVDVNGENACPLYKFLRSSKSGMPKEPINWNFTKFLVDRDGKVVERIPATNLPLSCENNIKKLLGISEVMELRAAGAPI